MFLRMGKRALRLLVPLLALLVLGADSPSVEWESTARWKTGLVKPVMAVDTGTSLDVEELCQYPELPNGCEATSLAAVLRFLGYDVTALELVYGYIPSEPIIYSEAGMLAYGPDPAEAYAGWPEEGYTGFYCFAGPIVQAANQYLAEQNSGWRAADITGASVLDLMRRLDEGTPMIVWATLNMDTRLFSSFHWTLPSGEEYYPFSNLHCMVLTGYEGDTFTLMDPIEGTVTVDREQFMSRYWTIGERAVAFGEDSQ